MEPVWSHFLDLCGSRQSGGMGLSPISYTEIAAYREQTLTDLSAWEVRLLKRLDLAVLAVAAGALPKPPAKPGSPDNMVSTQDTKGLRSLLGGIAARVSTKKAKGA